MAEPVSRAAAGGVVNPFAAAARLRRLQIEITTHCTLACQGCQRTIGRARRNWTSSHLALETFGDLLRHMPPADVLVLQGVGEPTLHPDLDALIRQGRAGGRYRDITMNTNALSVPLDAFGGLRTAGLSHLSVSVDSLNPVTAQACRAGTDVEELTRRVAALVRLFEGRITVSVTLSRLNLGELGALIERLVRLGVKSIEIQPLVGYGGAAESVRLTADELRWAAETATTLGQRLSGVTILLAAAMTPDGTRCRRPLHSAYLTVEGLMTPCCVTDDVDLLGRTSLVGQPFARAWQAPAVAAWFSSYLDREPSMCVGCGFNSRGPVDERLPELTEGRRLRRAGRAADASALLRRGASRLPLAELLGELGLATAGEGGKAAGVQMLGAAILVHDDPKLAHAQAVALLRQGSGAPEAALGLMLANLDRHPGFEPGWSEIIALLKGAAGTTSKQWADLARRALAAGGESGLVRIIDLLAAGGEPDDDRLGLAHQLRTQGRSDLARRLLEPMVARAPSDVAALMTLCVAQFEMIYLSEDEIDQRRRAFLDLLARTESALAEADAPTRIRAARQVGNAKPFYLSYQGLDDRAAMQAWGRIVTTLVGSDPAPLPPRRSEGRIRVGFVCAYFRMHSVSKLFGGWLAGFDRTRFEVVGYDVAERSTEGGLPPLADSCDLVRSGPHSGDEWRRIIKGDQPDVLIYPEVGMEPAVVRLAAQRLAPVQCATWGHPVTTGLASIDYFLSSELMEPETGAAQYSETLVRLPNLSIHYLPPVLPAGRALTRASFGLDEGDVVFICCQSLYKYLPRYDGVFARIAARVDRARFVFIAGLDPRTTDRFRQRLSAVFPGPGLARHCRLVPRIAHEDFPVFLALGDVYLDGIGWSGGNTTLEAVAVGLPVVTTPTDLMRGRHSAAILHRAGLGDQVAADVDGYVDLAVTLGKSMEARAEFRRRLAEGRGRLYDDSEPIRALERLLIDALGRA